MILGAQEVTWEIFKAFIDQRNLSPQYIEIDSAYLIYAIDGPLRLRHDLPKETPASVDQLDFEENYIPLSNKPIASTVQTQLEINDKDLKMATLKGDTDPDTGIVTCEVLIPGTPGVPNSGRYIMGAEAFFKTAHANDRVSRVDVVDVDNLLGYGAGAVLKSYHDDELPEENQGWYIGVDQYDSTGNASFIEVKPLGGYAFIPAGFYLRITAIKDSDYKTSTFYCNLFWGKYSL